MLSSGAPQDDATTIAVFTEPDDGEHPTFPTTEVVLTKSLVPVEGDAQRFLFISSPPRRTDGTRGFWASASYNDGKLAALKPVAWWGFPKSQDLDALVPSQVPAALANLLPGYASQVDDRDSPPTRSSASNSASLVRLQDLVARADPSHLDLAFDGRVSEPPAPRPKLVAAALQQIPLEPPPVPQSGLKLTTEAEKKQLIAAWTKNLGLLRSTQAEAKFLHDDRVTVEIIFDGEERRMGEKIAEYSRGTVYVNAIYVEMFRVGLAAQGVKPEQMREVLARDMMPYIAHELRHGITAEEVKQAAQMEFLGGLIEDEVLSFVDQAKVQAELAERWPETSKYSMLPQDRGLAQAWKAGPDQVEMYVRRIYKTDSILSTSNQDLAGRFRNNVQTVRNLQAARMTAKSRLNSGNPQERKEAKEFLDKMPPDGEMSDLLRKTDNVDHFISDPGRLDKMRDYYKKRYQEIQRDWRASQ